MNNSPKLDLSSIMKGKNIVNKNDDEKMNQENNVEDTNSTPLISDENKVNETIHPKLWIKSLKNETNKEEKIEENSKIEKEEEKIVETENIENKEIKVNSPKISLSSIKTNKSKDIISEEKSDQEEEKHKEMKEELIETLNKTEEKKSEENIENKIEETKKIDEIKLEANNEKTINEIKAKIDAEVDEETEKKLKIKKVEKEENTDNNSELFWNYKSDFDWKEEKIIKEIEIKRKNLREKLKEPKTRIMLVVTLIVITTSFIAWLFYLYPEKHSFNKYSKVITNNINNIKNQYFEKPWVDETITIETYNFKVLSQEKKWDEKNYNYMWIIYNSKNDLYTVLNK